jgi:hypothetical protein
MTDKNKVENDNGILEPATPHPALSRKGRGKSNDNDKSFISFWIATGRLSRWGRPLAMTDKNRMENDNGILEPATPHPALSRKGRGNDNDKNNISFWIATRLQRAPRN